MFKRGKILAKCINPFQLDLDDNPFNTDPGKQERKGKRKSRVSEGQS